MRFLGGARTKRGHLIFSGWGGDADTLEDNMASQAITLDILRAFQMISLHVGLSEIIRSYRNLVSSLTFFWMRNLYLSSNVTHI